MDKTCLVDIFVILNMTKFNFEILDSIESNVYEYSLYNENFSLLVII